MRVLLGLASILIAFPNLAQAQDLNENDLILLGYPQCSVSVPYMTYPPPTFAKHYAHT